MCAMNKVNQTQSCENSQLLNKCLKTEIGFPGIVYPDVGGEITSFGSANGGEDHGSSSYWSDTIIVEGISNGSMTQARLDMAERNLIAYYYYDLDNGEQPSLTYATTIGRDVEPITAQSSEKMVPILLLFSRTSIMLYLSRLQIQRHFSGFQTLVLSVIQESGLQPMELTASTKVI